MGINLFSRKSAKPNKSSAAKPVTATPAVDVNYHFVEAPSSNQPPTSGDTFWLIPITHFAGRDEQRKNAADHTAASNAGRTVHTDSFAFVKYDNTLLTIDQLTSTKNIEAESDYMRPQAKPQAESLGKKPVSERPRDRAPARQRSRQAMPQPELRELTPKRPNAASIPRGRAVTPFAASGAGAKSSPPLTRSNSLCSDSSTITLGSTEGLSSATSSRSSSPKPRRPSPYPRKVSPRPRVPLGVQPSIIYS